MIKSLLDLKEYQKHFIEMREYKHDLSMGNPTLLKDPANESFKFVCNNLFKVDEIEYNKSSISTSVEYISYILDYIADVIKPSNLKITFGSETESNFLIMRIISNGNFAKFTFDSFHRFKCYICDGDNFESNFNFCASDISHKKEKIQRIMPFCFG